jgi:hypothetical protein
MHKYLLLEMDIWILWRWGRLVVDPLLVWLLKASDGKGREGKRLTHRKYRIVCWFGSQYIFEILGIDIGFIGGWRTGKRHQIPRGNKSELIKAKYASSRGINILPYDRLQRYVNGIDLRSAVQDNMAFKISFGTTFALAAFMHF